MRGTRACVYVWRYTCAHMARIIFYQCAIPDGGGPGVEDFSWFSDGWLVRGWRIRQIYGVMCDVYYVDAICPLFMYMYIQCRRCIFFFSIVVGRVSDLEIRWLLLLLL